MGKRLGSGTFAMVREAQDISCCSPGSRARPSKPVAVKIFENVNDTEELQSVENEISIMRRLLHCEHCVQLLDVVREGRGPAGRADNKGEHVYVVMERMHGELTDLVRRARGGLKEDVARRFFQQVCQSAVARRSGRRSPVRSVAGDRRLERYAPPERGAPGHQARESTAERQRRQRQDR